LPLYEYLCLKCDRRIEKIEKLSGPHLKKCPHCGGAVEALISAPAIQFKGTGWYVTDYAKKSGGSDGPKGEKSENSGSKAETPAKESKKPGGTSKEK
jgi:putative FmdB family regulatory protein